MNPRLKAIAMALVAVLAVSAVGASAASATPPKFTSNSGYPVTVSGSQPAGGPHVFTADGFATTCEVANFSGTLAAASSELSLTPVTEKCKTAGVASTTTMNGCSYKLTMTTTGIPNLATVSLVCPAGQEVTVDVGNPAAPSCQIHIPPFTDKHHVKIENDHPGLLTTWTISSIKATLTDLTALCPFNGNTTVENATYNGTVTLAPLAGGTVDIG
jgi:hypothetical protein